MQIILIIIIDDDEKNPKNIISAKDRLSFQKL